VCAIHPFIAEVAAELIDPVETSYNESFEIKLVGYTQVKRYVQGIVMGDEGTGGRSSGYALEYGSVDFQGAAFIEEFAYRIYHLRTPDEGLLDLGIYHQVGIALAVPEFGIGDRIECLPLFFPDDGKRFERFCQESELPYVDGNLPGLCGKYIAFDAHDITQVQEVFPDLVI
jgi:hypothetical protein